MDPATILAIGGAIGSGLGGLSSFFNKNKSDQDRNINRFTPNQQSSLNALLSQSSAALQNRLSGSTGFNFQPIEQQARQGFEQKTIPSIANRFTALGQGAQRSSGFGQALGSAGSDFESNLASLKSQIGLQQDQMNSSLLQNLLQIGLSPQFDTIVRQPGPSAGAILGSNAASQLPDFVRILQDQYNNRNRDRTFEDTSEYGAPSSQASSNKIPELMKVLQYLLSRYSDQKNTLGS